MKPFFWAIKEGERCPRMCGPCWYENWRRTRVVAPIPLNVLIVAVRWAWQWVAWRFFDVLDRHSAPRYVKPPQEVMDRLYVIRDRMRAENKFVNVIMQDGRLLKRYDDYNFAAMLYAIDVLEGRQP